MKKHIVALIAIAAVGSFAQATICETEMKKFAKVSETRRAGICQSFNDDATFKIFRDCLLTTAQKFNSTFTDEKLIQTEEKNLDGIMSLCSGGMTMSSKKSQITR